MNGQTNLDFATLFPALVIDLETQGLFNFKLPADHPEQPRIVQIGGVYLDIDGLEPGASPVRRIMNRLIKPDGWTIPAEATAIHGITTEMCEEKGVPIAAALDELMEMWATCAVFSSYGMQFDSKGIRGELRRAGRPDCFGIRPEVCLMQTATPICKLPRASGNGFKFPKLREAVDMLLPKKPQAQAHDALSDAYDAARLYYHFAKNGLLQPKIRPSKEDR